MEIPFYLAMTAAEFAVCRNLPPQVAWLACHFSSSGPGLTNIPTALPSESVLIIDDSQPFCDHSPETIAGQLGNAIKALDVQALVLDFQRQADNNGKQLAAFLRSRLPCPVVAPPEYAYSEMPVLLPPCPLNLGLEEYIEPYKNREIWLEASLEGMELRITKSGCHANFVPRSDTLDFPHPDAARHTNYRIAASKDAITFHFQRTREDLDELLAEAEALGIFAAIGLWQEVKDFL